MFQFGVFIWQWWLLWSWWAGGGPEAGSRKVMEGGSPPQEKGRGAARSFCMICHLQSSQTGSTEITALQGVPGADRAWLVGGASLP